MNKQRPDGFQFVDPLIEFYVRKDPSGESQVAASCCPDPMVDVGAADLFENPLHAAGKVLPLVGGRQCLLQRFDGGPVKNTAFVDRPRILVNYELFKQAGVD